MDGRGRGGAGARGRAAGGARGRGAGEARGRGAGGARGRGGGDWRPHDRYQPRGGGANRPAGLSRGPVNPRPSPPWPVTVDPTLSSPRQPGDGAGGARGRGGGDWRPHDHYQPRGGGANRPAGPSWGPVNPRPSPPWQVTADPTLSIPRQPGDVVGGARGRGGVDRRPQDRYQPRDGGANRPAGQPWGPVNPNSPPNPSIPRQTGDDLRMKQKVDQIDPSPSNVQEKLVAVPRPDNGGTEAVRYVALLVNHFPLRFEPGNIIFHYNVVVEPDMSPKNDRQAKVSKQILSLIREQLFADNPDDFPLAKTAYDGEKNIFSAVRLPEEKFTVKLFDGDGEKERSYSCTIKLVNELKFSKLRDYLAGNVSPIPREVLQGMDLVMRENPARNMVSFGRSFYPIVSRPEDKLEGGVAAYRGFQHSLKPTEQGIALCLDYSVLAFRKRMAVLDYLKERIPEFTITDFGKYRIAAEKELKGLKVTVTHRRTRQKYTIGRFTDLNTRVLSFDVVEGTATRQVSLVEYFMRKYGKEISHKDIPCLDVGRSNQTNWIPMELCVLVEGQRYSNENLDRNGVCLLKKKSLVRPQERREQILEMVSSRDGPRGGGISNNFGIEVGEDMTRVVGRVIGPPMLKVANSNGRPLEFEVDKNKCHWNFFGKRVPDGKTIKRWAVLDFSSSDKNNLRFDLFIQSLIRRCRILGIHMDEPIFHEKTNMGVLSKSGYLLKKLEWASQQGQLQFLLCVMSKKHPGYKYLKWLSETKVGIVTQCCLSSAANRVNDQYLANLALKINAKLGGSNVELSDQFEIFKNGTVMFIGADVNHPASRNATIPSISAVVGTVNWPAANRYAARVVPQAHRVERIVKFGAMCLELTDIYAQFNGARPDNIVIFRDGVSESQFDMVLNEELLDVRNVFLAINYNPTITLIVAQKRHQTRLFPETYKGGSRDENVVPGTVVDTTIVHPFDFDFYLCSHFGGLGTSKATHYYVLWNEHGFGSDHLQQLIYNLCFTFARCTKPVSLVTPVYYADLAAYRGRFYHDALSEDQLRASSSSSSRASTSVLPAGSFEERFYKLHGHLENGMFFI